MPSKSKDAPRGLMMHVNTNVAALSANGSSVHFGQPQLSHKVDIPLASPTKKGWQASVATQAPPRPIRRTYRDKSAASSANSLRQPGTYHSSSRRNPSVSSLGFSSFPGIPSGGAATMHHQDGRSTDTLNDRFRGIARKMSFNKSTNDPSQIDLSLTSEENERNTGLGIHAAAASSNATSRRPSLLGNRSIMSNRSQATQTHLADNVGFSFKTTTNFVHPHRQTPRTFSTHSSRSRTQSYATGMYSDEADEDYADRMNSITSDGGWKSGWNMRDSGSASNSVSGEAAMDFPVPNAMAPQRRSRNSAVLEDLGPDDLPPVKEDLSPGTSPPRNQTIEEEADMGPLHVTTSAISDDLGPTDLRPAMAAAIAASVDMKRSSSQMSSSQSSADMSPGASVHRSRASTNQSSNNSLPERSVATASPFEKALNFLSKDKDLEPENASSRSASIRAARAAFEEKEAAKDKKVADRQAKREAWLRRKSETVDWIARRRKPSIAVDSAIDSEQRTPASDGSLDGSASDEDASPRHLSGTKFTPFVEPTLAEEVVDTARIAEAGQPTEIASHFRNSQARTSLAKLDVTSIQEAATRPLRNSRARSSLAKLANFDVSALEDGGPLRNSLARGSGANLLSEAELKALEDQSKASEEETPMKEWPAITYDTIQEDVSPSNENGQDTKPDEEVSAQDNALWPPITYTPVAEGASPSTDANPHTPGGEGTLWPPISYEQYPLVETPGTATESMLWPPIDYASISNANSPRTGFVNSPRMAFANSPRTGFTGNDSDMESIRDDAKSEHIQMTPASKGKGGNRFLSKLGFGSKSRMLKV